MNKNEIGSAAALLGLLQSPHAASADLFATLLHPEVRYARLSERVTGRAAVIAALQKEATLALVQRLHWSAPRSGVTGVQLCGQSSPDSRDRSLILTLAFSAGRIIEIQQQFGAPLPAPASPLRLSAAITTLINEALATRHPMLLAFTGVDEQPRLSFRGSVHVHSPSQLAMWVRNAQGGLIGAIAQRPRVALMYRNEDSRATYQFEGRARVLDGEAERRRIYEAAPQAERDHDFAMLGAAVVIDLDRVEGYAGMGPAGQMDRVLMLAGSA